MSNGYLVAAGADLAAARTLGDGFGLEILNLDAISDYNAAAALLANAPNIGLILSDAATRDVRYYALLHALGQKLQRAQLIVVEPQARASFGFFPSSWPTLTLEEALRRATEARRRRDPQPEPPPLPIETPATDPPPPSVAAAEPPHAESDDERVRGITTDEPVQEPPPSEENASPAKPPEDFEPPAEAQTEAENAAPEPPAKGDPPAFAPQASGPDFTSVDAMRTNAGLVTGARGRADLKSAPADATAFAPKKLRRETPELVRIVVHQPKDLKDVIKTAKRIDPRAEAAPQGMKIGDVPLGSSVGVALDVTGAICKEAEMQRRTWKGEPIDFGFTLEAETDVKQAVIRARVFVDDAQIGMIAFTRPISDPAKKPAPAGDARMKRYKRVFLSYSSKDLPIISTIVTAYEAAGIPHFWDRASLKSGEEWSPRLRQEIDRADLFHLCWSKAAAKSEWVVKETAHALTRRRRSNGKHPDITVQMLDGPPWAPHDANLDSINFDDFTRAAVVGYARGDGSEPT